MGRGERLALKLVCVWGGGVAHSTLYNVYTPVIEWTLFRGLGEPIRLILEYAGANYEDRYWVAIILFHIFVIIPPRMYSVHYTDRSCGTICPPPQI